MTGVVDVGSEVAAEPIHLPTGPVAPAFVQGLVFAAGRHKALAAAHRRYGPCFSAKVPFWGKVFVLGEGKLIKELLSSSSDLVDNASGLDTVLPAGSMVRLYGAEHRRRRKLLAPSFNGRRMRNHESMIEEEVLREIATWPEGVEFACAPSIRRLTLNALLRAVFDAEGEDLAELRQIIPRMSLWTSRLAVLPPALRRDLGPHSPWGRLQRDKARYEEIITSLIESARRDPGLEDRDDVLGTFLQARYDDGTSIDDAHIADELFALLGAGHETTSASISWAIERLRRHPDVLSRLTAESDSGGHELRQATIWEVQRTRPSIEMIARSTRRQIRLGEWVIPEDSMILVDIACAHNSHQSFVDAEAFNPDRFVGNPPESVAWLAYGAGVRRCVGAVFANLHQNVTLRVLLRELEIATTDAPGEGRRYRGITPEPRRGGLLVMRWRRRHAVAAASALA
ncbi:cytochrome P450 [Mycobacterium sp.]|uniref:cytochrome P450 n=1 Tax=Mycobacterium sp. TaxID=1785 RepID=UPI002D9B9635|nr:cytochrome P450 [Mycobacterium sp.]